MANRPYTSDAWAKLSIKQREASLRARATPSEIQLKALLDFDPRTRTKFKFQAHCCGYYVDFLCVKQKLIVELDGAVHAGTAAKIADAKRTRKLALKGYRMVRFWNGELRQPTAVLCRILNAMEFDRPQTAIVHVAGFPSVEISASGFDFAHPSLSLDAIIVNTRPRRRAGASA